ncbi:MAG: flippase-like domain-containing protein [Halobacteriales archaeon]
MAGSAVDVSVILPAYNEAETLSTTVERTLEALDDLDLPAGYEVLVAEDGCSDDTPAVAEALAASNPTVRHLHSDERLGRGRALERAARASRGSIVVYFDTDLATDLGHLGELIAAVRDGPAAIATGSRLLPDSEADRPIGRDVPSRVYNGLARILLASAVRDHQCGFKAFDRAVLLELLDDIRAEHWFWDTEVLVRAQRAGHEVAELPVRWTAQDATTVDLAHDAPRMGWQLLHLSWELRVRPTLWRLRTVITLVVTLLLGYLVLETVADPSAILDRIARVDPLFLAIAGAMYLASWPIRGVRYRDILAELGHHERVDVLTGAIFVSQTGNLIVPARAGDAIRAYILKSRREVPYTTGFASLAVERIFDLLTITMLAGGVLVGLVAVRGPGVLATTSDDPGVGGGRLAVAIAGAVAVVVLAGFAALLISARLDDRRWSRFGGSRVPALDRALTALARFLVDVRAVSTRPRAVGQIGLTSLAIWSIDVLSAVVVLAAFDVDLAVGTLLAVGTFAVSVGNLAKIVPVSPGGIGPYEAGFAVLVVALTPVGVTVAVAAAIVDHALKNLLTAAGGVVATGALNVSLVTAAREGRAGRRSTDVGLRE